MKRLIPGLNFAAAKRLTNAEIQILLPFFSGNYTSQKIAKVCNKSIESSYRILNRLGMKGIIEVFKIDSLGCKIYTLNKKVIEEFLNY